MVKCAGIGARRPNRDGKARQHKPHRIVIAFKGKALQPGAYQNMLDDKAHYREQIVVEADKTRWWLQERDLWNDKQLVTNITLPADTIRSTREVSTFPIFDNPDAADETLAAYFFLGFDAKIYFFTEKGAKQFDPDKEDAHPENMYLVDKLRRTRSE